MNMSLPTIRGIVLVFAAFLPTFVCAQTFPHTFTNGSIADADELNANFDAIEQHVENRRGVYETSVVANGILVRTLANIDHTAFVNLCGDNTGCVARLCVYSEVPETLTSSDLTECSTPWIIAYDAPSGRWSFREIVGGAGFLSTDGDDVSSDPLTFGACAISDGETSGPTTSLQDLRFGFSVVNNYSTPGRGCSVALSD